MIATKYHDRLSIFNQIPLLKRGGNSYFVHNKSTFPWQFPLNPPPIFHSSLFKLLLSHPSSHHLPPVESPSCCSSFVLVSLLGFCHPHYSHCFVLFLCFFFFFCNTRESCPSQLYNHEGRGRKKKRGSVEFGRGFKRTCPFFCQLDEA